MSDINLDRLRSEVDRLKRVIATGYCGECDVLKEKLGDIRRIIGEAENGVPEQWWMTDREYSGAMDLARELLVVLDR